MAQQWRDGKRHKAKIGDHPSMSLAQGREIFKRDYAQLIQKGRSVKIAADSGGNCPDYDLVCIEALPSDTSIMVWGTHRWAKTQAKNPDAWRRG
jgi:hypothetical protein